MFRDASKKSLGVAYCHSGETELNKIRVITEWPGNQVAPKIPTTIQYLQDRESLWGCGAHFQLPNRQSNNGSTIYTRFKLKLEPSSTNTYNSIRSSFFEHTSSIRLP